MKKLVLFFAVIVAVSFASCKSKTEAPVEGEATEEVVAAEEAPVDSAAAVVDSAAVAQ
jgi:hypothetical protein